MLLVYFFVVFTCRSNFHIQLYVVAMLFSRAAIHTYLLLLSVYACHESEYTDNPILSLFMRLEGRINGYREYFSTRGYL